MSDALFAPGLKVLPWWWEAAEPPERDTPQLPDRAMAAGTHAALARGGGLYARLAALQLGDGG
jgi:hypothetical protein